MRIKDPRPLVAHVVFRFDVGGLENGVVNLLNGLPSGSYLHTVISMTEATHFHERVRVDDVDFVSLHKPPGHGFWLGPRLFRIFRRLRPTIVHTRNLAALESLVPAWLAGVPVRIHGEHGRDVGDLDGSNQTYRLVRRAYRPFVTHYVALSRDLERYLVEAIGVPTSRTSRIVNGVDTALFRPVQPRRIPTNCPFSDETLFVCGTVGRLQAVKNQTLLAQAFVRALQIAPNLRARLRLVIVGEGPLREQVLRVLRDADAGDLAWLPGTRDDVHSILSSLDAFVLPSLAEGISNTILEAMATGLPVVATRVGGNGELVDDGVTGIMVQSGDVEAMARALVRYATVPGLGRQHGNTGRARAERHFSVEAMIAKYAELYELLIQRHGQTRRLISAPVHAPSDGG